jgi:hypothetical protein
MTSRGLYNFTYLCTVLPNLVLFHSVGDTRSLCDGQRVLNSVHHHVFEVFGLL